MPLEWYPVISARNPASKEQGVSPWRYYAHQSAAFNKFQPARLTRARPVIGVVGIIALFLIAGCVAPHIVMHNSMRINVGQSKNDVLKIMGNPGNRQFKGDNEAWQWCETDQTGFSGDDYVVIWFFKGNVTGVTTYKNTLIGNCEMFYRTINWEEAPDKIIEHRVKHQ